MNLTRCTYKDLKEFVSTNRERVLEWALAIQKIKNEGWWREDCKTWEEWCEQFCGKSASAIRSIIWKGEARKLIESTTGEKPASVPAERPNTSKPPKPEPAPIEVAAKVSKPEPPAKQSAGPDLPRAEKVSIESKWKQLLKDLDWLTHQQIEYNLLKVVCRCLCEAKEVHQMLQPALPMEVESSKKRSKGTQESVIQYCVLVKLTETDGEWFYQKMVGTGWKVNGLAVNDWQAVVNQWKIQKIFPSQKESGHATSFNRGTGQGNSGRNAGTYNDASQYANVHRAGH
jgi:hypothetical protein